MLASSWGLCHQKSCITSWSIKNSSNRLQTCANMLFDAGLNSGGSGCPYEVAMSMMAAIFLFAQALRLQSGSLQPRCKCTSQQSERIANVAQYAPWHVKPQYVAFAWSEIQYQVISDYHSTSFHYIWTSTPQTQPFIAWILPSKHPWARSPSIALFYADVCIGLHWAFQTFPKAAD